MANVKACLIQDSPVIKKNNLKPPQSPNSSQQISTFFFSLFEVEEIRQQGQQQRLDVGSLQEFLGTKQKTLICGNKFGQTCFFLGCDRWTWPFLRIFLF